MDEAAFPKSEVNVFVRREDVGVTERVFGRGGSGGFPTRGGRGRAGMYVGTENVGYGVVVGVGDGNEDEDGRLRGGRADRADDRENVPRRSWKDLDVGEREEQNVSVSLLNNYFFMLLWCNNNDNELQRYGI